MRMYYACSCRFNDVFAFFLWYADEQDGFPKDGVVLDEQGYMLLFQTQPLLVHYAERNNLPLEHDDPTFYDLDRINRWIETSTIAAIGCPDFLNAWNLFGDLALSLSESRFPGNDDQATPLYDKLFWGSNLPSMTPPGEHFEPMWEAGEAEQLQEVLRYGLQLVRDHVKVVGELP